MPVAGQQFEYAFDDIGNRETSGGRESSVSTYTANLLNQYDQRTVAGKVDVLGVANVQGVVEVKESANTYSPNRKGEYFHHAVPVSNFSGSAYPTIEVEVTYQSQAESDTG